MKNIRICYKLLFLCASLFVSSCDSVSLNEDAGDVEFVLGGGITTDFSDGSAAYEGEISFSRSGIANRLDVELSVRCVRDEMQEQARLSFRFAYASNSGELPPGEYSVVPDDLVPSIGEASYESSKREGEYTRYGLAGSSLRLDVEESESGRLVAHFVLNLEQQTGERLQDGQLLSVVLTGPVQARGSFDLPIDGLEFVDPE